MAQKYYKFKNSGNTKFAAWVFHIYKPVAEEWCVPPRSIQV